MRKQEIYNTVRDHLLKQNRHSIINGVCQYRGPGLTKCAVGCLIPDDLYTPGMEGSSVQDPRIKKDSFREMNCTNRNIIWPILRKIGITARHYNLIADLQDVHDSHDPVDWPDSLRSIAKQYNLKP